MPRTTEEALAELAASQFGLLTRCQAVDLGVTDHQRRYRLQIGRWKSVHPDVYRIGGAPNSPEQTLLAACLLGGTGTLVARRSAAWLWGLPGGASLPATVVSPRWSRVQRRGIDAHETKAIGAADEAERFGIPVTSVCRTLIDCCAVLPAERAGPMLDDARRRGLVTLGAFARRVDELGASGRNGIALARRLTADRGAPPASVFESRLGRVLRDAGLPEPVRGHRVHLGGETFELDFAYPDLRIGIEADSEAFHLDLAAFRRDRAKQNALTLLGWRLLRFTWHDVTRAPAQVVLQVAGARSLAS